MSTLPAGYIPQCKATSGSSGGSLGFIVCEVLGWLIMYQDGDYLQPIGQYSQTICQLQLMMMPPSVKMFLKPVWVGKIHGVGVYATHVVRIRWFSNKFSIFLLKMM